MLAVLPALQCSIVRSSGHRAYHGSFGAAAHARLPDLACLPAGGQCIAGKDTQHGQNDSPHFFCGGPEPPHRPNAV